VRAVGDMGGCGVSELIRFHSEISIVHSVKQWANTGAYPNRFLSSNGILAT